MMILLNVWVVQSHVCCGADILTSVVVTVVVVVVVTVVVVVVVLVVARGYTHDQI